MLKLLCSITILIKQKRIGKHIRMINIETIRDTVYNYPKSARYQIDRDVFRLQLVN